jgi:hypothetical protein
MGMYSGGGILSTINKVNPFAEILKLNRFVSNKILPAPKASKPQMPSLPPSARQIMQYPEGISTGVGGGNAASSRSPMRPRASFARPTSRPIQKTAPTPDPYAKELTEYNKLISQGKIEEAEKLGMDIWSKKYANTSMTKPRTKNPLMDNLETAQNNLMNSTTSNATNTKTIPLPPDYIKIPSSKNKETNDDTMAPPPSINPPSSIFSRNRSTVKSW